jgi:hypothetical protein
MGRPNRGDGLACKPEVKAMRLRPFAITFEVKRTRTSWQVTVRIQII